MPTYSYTIAPPSTGGGTSVSGVEASNAGNIKEELREAFGTDIFYESDYSLTHKGDYALVSGFKALRQAILHRLITKPGEYAFEPNYGIGIQSFVKKKIVQSTLDDLEIRIRTQLLREKRISGIRSLNINRISGGVEIYVVIEAAGRALQFRPFRFTKDSANG